MGRKYGSITPCISTLFISSNVKCVLNTVKSCGIHFIVSNALLLYTKTGSEEIKLMKLTISNKLVNFSVLSAFFSNKTPEYETYSTHLTVQTVCIVILTNTDYLGCIQFVGHLLAYGISKNSTLTLGSESKCQYKNDTFLTVLTSI